MISSEVAQKIIDYCEQKNYPTEGFTIIYVEGMSINGYLNEDEPNQFNDVRLIFEDKKLVDCWQATCEPGRWYTVRPMNPGGAFRIAFGFHKNAWQIGTHGQSDRHEALIQVGEIVGHRDANKDMIRSGDKKVQGLFGVNQHWGYDMPPDDIGKASAGCLVGRSRAGHRQFMSLCHKSGKKLFSTIVVPGNEILI